LAPIKSISAEDLNNAQPALENTMQSNDVVLALMDEYQRGFAPPDLILSEKNAGTMLVYAIEKYGLVSISYLIEAEQTLGAQLDRVPPPRVKTQDEIAKEFQAKELKRIQREQLENAVPFQDRAAAAEKDKKNAETEKARQISAWKERDRLIDNYSINLGPGRIDHSRSEYFKEQLRGIKATRNGTMDWVVVLKTVQEALAKLP
jgi:hypothetical protein